MTKAKTPTSKTTLPENWDAIQARTIRDDGKRCCVCGKGWKLTVHHRDEDESNNAPENLMTMCAHCHDKLPVRLFEESRFCLTKPDGDGSICLRLGRLAGNLGPQNCPFNTKDHGCLLESAKILPEGITPEGLDAGWPEWRNFITAGQFHKNISIEKAPNEQSPDSGDDGGPGTPIPWFIDSRIKWEKWWWKKPNKLCARCQGECKQSWRASVIRCRQFQGVN